MLEPRARSFLLLACVCFAASSLHAQTSLAWVRSYAQPLDDRIGGVVVDAAGRSFVAGSTALPGASTEGYLTAWDQTGLPLFTRTITLSGQAVAWHAIALGPNGRIAVAGSRRTLATTHSSDLLVAEYDSQGNLAWSASWNGPAARDDQANAVTFDPNGRVVVAGGTSLATTPDTRDGFVAVYDAQGVLAWVTPTAVPTSDDIVDLAVDANGRVYSVGNGGGFPVDSYVVCFDANGVRAWTATRPLEYLNAIAVDGAQDVHVAGSLLSTSTGAASFHMASLAGFDGATRWTRTVQGAGVASAAVDVAVNSFGEVVATGSLDQGAANGYDGLALASNLQGGELWRAQFDPGAGLNAGFTMLRFGPGGDLTQGGVLQVAANGSQRPLVQRLTRGAAPAASWTYSAQPIVGVEVRDAAHVVLDPAGGVIVAGRANALPPQDVVVWRLEPLATALCFGDGTGNACPCGNTSQAAERAGCRSSLGVGGRLEWSGTPSLAADTFTLRAAFLPHSPGRFVQGSTAPVGGTPFGDGLLCVSGAIVRLGTKVAVGGSSRYPEAGDAIISVRGLVPAPGAARSYQLHYRNSANFCTSAAFNLTNSVTTIWQP